MEIKVLASVHHHKIEKPAVICVASGLKPDHLVMPSFLKPVTLYGSLNV